jgi:hypothetical protein
MKNMTNLAAREFLASGKPLTEFEALLLFGAAHLPNLVSELRKQGEIISSEKISYAAVVRRINEHAVFTPPTNLPVRDIYFTEWWISK